MYKFLHPSFKGKEKRNEFDRKFKEKNNDFSDLLLSSLATKICRLDAYLSPIIEEDSFPENHERAIIIFNPSPLHQCNTPPLCSSPSNPIVSLHYDFISDFKNQFLRAIDMKSVETEEDKKDNEGCLAVVPWVPSQIPSVESIDVGERECRKKGTTAEKIELWRGGVILKFFDEFHRGGKWEEGINHSFITLIPKKLNPEALKDFGTISLVGGIYKILSKVLASRLRLCADYIISNTQFAFIPGTQISDFSFIANECIDEIVKKRSKGIVFKVDFKRAYDTVDWHFLIRLMKEMNFGDRCCDWIFKCISTASISVLVNGSPTERNLKRILRVFELASRLQLNLKKSRFFGINVPGDELATWANSVGCAVGKFSAKYLGLPLGPKRNSIAIWDGIRRRIHWVKWSELCKPKELGGLDISDLAVHNRALIEKWIWRFANEKDSLWQRVISYMGTKVESGWSWNVVPRWQPFDWECDQWLEFNAALSSSLSVDRKRNVWVGVAPLKVELFLWQVIQKRIPMKSELIKQGITSITDISCPLCRVHMENEMAFQKSRLDINQLWFLAKYRLASWFKVKNPNVKISMEDIVADPSLVDQATRITKPVVNAVWKPPPVGAVKLNVDGAMRRDGLSGGFGGIFRNAEGLKIGSFSEPVGQALVRGVAGVISSNNVSPFYSKSFPVLAFIQLPQVKTKAWNIKFNCSAM
ncbi:hypothetical protein F3Y22_tig00110383pilonHSYRG00030 [Hibiscus syriacus]|uniref:Reverse transcriptase domain-containing protein n=1 Tax=Hibiscus syriacus TaxID=106335 RepID=A0A6A3AVN5_HIBSY|nr:hypothetical protein F3Y22_tig00110383pilonHSYRG00030 [Hibiscus syriacus]